MLKPGGCHSSGISLGDVLRLPKRHPAWRRREAQSGSCRAPFPPQTIRRKLRSRRGGNHSRSRAPLDGAVKAEQTAFAIALPVPPRLGGRIGSPGSTARALHFPRASRSAHAAGQVIMLCCDHFLRTSSATLSIVGMSAGREIFSRRRISIKSAECSCANTSLRSTWTEGFASDTNSSRPGRLPPDFMK
jgi:hypothetical protein